MDKRQKRTKKAIYEAFTKLLQNKSYFNISVQEIIDEADIGRSTFYSHFETKDELLISICNEIFAHVFSNNLSKENTHDFSSTKKELKAEITHILYHLLDNKDFLKPILTCGSSEIFMKYFKEHLETLFNKEINKIKKKSAKIPQSYLINHLVCDFAESVRWWMKNENYTPEEISSFFLESTLI